MNSVILELNSCVIDLSDEVREEIERLRREMDDLRQRLESDKERGRPPPGEAEKELYVSIGDFVDEVVGGLANGIRSEVNRAIMIGPGGIYIGHPRQRGERDRADFPEVAGILEALANEHRLRIMDSLTSGGKYASDLEKEFSSISPSTLSSHLKTLEEAGLIAQEATRGRYLITLPGRIALKMATRVTRLLKPKRRETGKEEP